MSVITGSPAWSGELSKDIGLAWNTH